MEINKPIEIKAISKFYSRLYIEIVFGIWHDGWMHLGPHILFFYEEDAANKFLSLIQNQVPLAELRRAQTHMLNMLNLYYLKPAIITTIDRRGKTDVKYDGNSKEIQHILIRKEDIYASITPP